MTWQQPIRLRNRIVHGYWSVDIEILHTTAHEQISPRPDDDESGGAGWPAR